MLEKLFYIIFEKFYGYHDFNLILCTMLLRIKKGYNIEKQISSSHLCLFQMRGIFCSLFIQAEHDMTEMLVFCIKTTNINITFDGSK